MIFFLDSIISAKVDSGVLSTEMFESFSILALYSSIELTSLPVSPMGPTVLDIILWQFSFSMEV